MKKFLTSLSLSASALAIPALAYAQTYSNTYCSNFKGSLSLGSGATFTDLIRFLTCFMLKSIIPFFFALALMFFIYGVVDYIRASATGGEELGQKKQFMVWGIIALAVMLSVWGLVSIITTTFHTGNVIPQLPVGGQ